MYNEKFLDHFQNPRFAGRLPPPAVAVEVSNPACGDILHLSARFEHGVVAEARFLVRGCSASIAAGSALAEWITGKRPEEIAALRPAEIEDALGGLAPESRHAATLCLDAAKALLAATRSRP